MRVKIKIASLTRISKIIESPSFTQWVANVIITNGQPKFNVM